MAKLELSDVASLQNEQTVISTLTANNRLIEAAIENSLSLDGTEPNSMTTDLDVGGFKITNLATPTADTDAVTKAYVDDATNIADAAALSSAVTAAQTAETNAEAAQVLAEAAAEKMTGTSVTTITPSVGTQTFTTQADKFFNVGTHVSIHSDANPSTVYMLGQVTAYSGTTLEVNVTAIGTATESEDWTIYVAAKSITGATGATGAAGADYTASSVLNALHGFSATPGIVVQTADNVFSPRTITGTSGKITVTDGDGAAGNPTLTVGSDVLQTNVTKTMTVGVTHTAYDHGSKAGTASISPLFSLGALQKASLAASSVITVNAPTTEEGMCILQLTNTGAPTSVTFSGFDKQLLGATYALTINKIYWVYIYSIGTMQAYQIHAMN